jgi:hypothetical protein
MTGSSKEKGDTVLTLADVHDLATTLQASGETISANKIVEHRGGSKRDALKLMRLYRAETHEPPTTPAAPVAVLEPAMVPEDASPAALEPVSSPTLLAQAAQRLQAALAEERHCRRAYDLATDLPERARCQQAWAAAKREREHAATRIEQLTRSRDARLAAIPAARLAARQAAGELASVQEQARRVLLRAQRQAEMTQEELDRMVNDLVTIAGAEAVPEEDGV